MSEALRLENVTRVYTQGSSTLEVFRNVNCTLRQGELVALVGPLRRRQVVAAAHGRPARSAVRAARSISAAPPASTLPDGERTRIRRDTIGFVYQAHHLLPEFSALENVVMPQRIAGRPRAEAERDAAHVLSYLGLGRAPDAPPFGAFRRRAAARRHRPRPGQPAKILLADEPHRQSRFAHRRRRCSRRWSIWCAPKASPRSSPRTISNSPPAWTAPCFCTRGKLLDGGKLGQRQPV